MSNSDPPNKQRSEAQLREIALTQLRLMTPEQRFQVAVRAGIYTIDGELTQPYQTETNDLSEVSAQQK